MHTRRNAIYSLTRHFSRYTIDVIISAISKHLQQAPYCTPRLLPMCQCRRSMHMHINTSKPLKISQLPLLGYFKRHFIELRYIF